MERIGGEDTGMPTSIRKVVLASFIGTTIEWYDYFIFVTAASLIHVRQAQPGVEQRPLEREAAPDQERHQIATPVRLYVRGLVDESPFPVDPVFRDVRP